MEKPSNLLLKFSQKLFSEAIAQGQFVDALVHPPTYAPCILWCQPKPDDFPFEVEPPVDWQPEFVDRLAPGSKPGQHPLHHQGSFYCLDFSSVFAASAVMQVQTPVHTIFDMCASPGGKSIFAWRSLHPQRMFCNEVIGKRRGALISNLKRCGLKGSTVLSLDSQVLAQEIPQTADLVLVDAPCTGQSLLAKGEKNPGCFHPVNINKNANRQKRIVANSAQLAAPGGYLAYMTCAYSQEENEGVVDWLLDRFPHFQPVSVPALQSYQSHLTDLPCYRMFPQDGLGAGAFTVLLRNLEEGEKREIPSEFSVRPGMVHVE